jgi:hypothetical protein
MKNGDFIVIRSDKKIMDAVAVKIPAESLAKFGTEEFIDSDPAGKGYPLRGFMGI